MNRILKLNRCRALAELKGREPLTDLEYQHLIELAETCPLQGQHFDEVSWLYPLRIPIDPKIRILDETDHIVSVLVIFNRRICVGLIGDEELERVYTCYPGSLIYAVGEISSRTKDGIEFKNMRPRGWMVYPITGLPPTEEIKAEKDRKKKKT